MVSPISAFDSRSPRVQASARIAPVAGKAGAEEAATARNAEAQRPTPVLSPGARDALPAGYRNLALPLGTSGAGAVTTAAQRAASGPPRMAAYGPSEAVLAALPRLVGNRLSIQIVLRETQAAARERAEARGETPAELLEKAPIVAPAKLPSRNAGDAEPTLRASLLAREGERETAALDIYLAKTGPSSFEIVTYDRDFAAPSGGFPYSAPPLSRDRILFDPACQAIIAVAAGQGLSVRRADARRVGLGRAILAVAIATATLLALAFALAADRPAIAVVAAGAGLCGLASALRSRRLR